MQVIPAAALVEACLYTSASPPSTLAAYIAATGGHGGAARCGTRGEDEGPTPAPIAAGAAATEEGNAGALPAWGGAVPCAQGNARCAAHGKARRGGELQGKGHAAR